MKLARVFIIVCMAALVVIAPWVVSRKQQAHTTGKRLANDHRGQ